MIKSEIPFSRYCHTGRLTESSEIIPYRKDVIAALELFLR